MDLPESRSIEMPRSYPWRDRLVLWGISLLVIGVCFLLAAASLAALSFEFSMFPFACLLGSTMMALLQYMGTFRESRTAARVVSIMHLWPMLLLFLLTAWLLYVSFRSPNLLGVFASLLVLSMVYAVVAWQNWRWARFLAGEDFAERPFAPFSLREMFGLITAIAATFGAASLIASLIASFAA